MSRSPRSRWGLAACWAVASTVLIEAVTVALRLGTGMSGEEVCRDAPLVVRMHHLFWSVPLLLVVPIPLVWRSRRWSGALLGIAVGLVASDLVHHFLVLPLWVGNTGWHWP